MGLPAELALLAGARPLNSSKTQAEGVNRDRSRDLGAVAKGTPR